LKIAQHRSKRKSSKITKKKKKLVCRKNFHIYIGTKGNYGVQKELPCLA